MRICLVHEEYHEETNLLLKWEEKMLLSADKVTCCSYALRDIINKEFS